VVPLGSRSATSVSQRIGIVLACVTSASASIVPVKTLVFEPMNITMSSIATAPLPPPP